MKRFVDRFFPQVCRLTPHPSERPWSTPVPTRKSGIVGGGNRQVRVCSLRPHSREGEEPVTIEAATRSLRYTP